MMSLIPIIICVIGLIMYFIAANEKVQEIGRIMFWTGLLSVLLGHYPMMPH